MKLNFGEAIKALKQGKKVARNGWNGKNMYIVAVYGKSSHYVKQGDEEYQHVTTDLPYLLMYTATNKYQPGWLASQADMLAEDWEVVTYDHPELEGGKSR